jgi:hypothetical protein
MVFGTNSVLDTLRAANQPVMTFGEDRVYEAISIAFAAHARLERDMADALLGFTTERFARYGANAEMQMERIDEFGRPDAQKVQAGATVGFPLANFGGSLQWTRLHLLNATTREIAIQAQAMLAADTRNRLREMKYALFYPANRTIADVRVDNVDIPVKALANADGAPIPPGPNGEVFDGSTHTHYLARAGGSVVQADVLGLIATVTEHEAEGQIRVYINAAQETTVRGFADFHPYMDPRLRPALDATVAIQTLDLYNVGDRAIGVLGVAEVWVKPWIPAGYWLAYHTAGEEVLRMRERSEGSGDLTLAFQNELYPLRAETYVAEYGIGVYNRVGAAVLYGGGTTYAAPTL